MNILFLSTHLNTGGISSYILTLSKELLRDKSHNVYVITSGGDKVSELISYGAKHTALNIRTKSELSCKIYSSVGDVCNLVREYNVDIIHSQTRVTQVLGCLSSWKTGVPCVSTCHGFFKKRLSRKLFPCWGQSVIAISDAVRGHLKNDFNVPDKKITLIYNGVDTEKFTSNSLRRKQKRAELKVEDRVVIGIIGRLSDVKGHDILIRAMQNIVRQIPNAILLIFGTGKTEQELRNLTEELHLQNYVRFYSVTANTNSTLQLFDAVATPSMQEGLGISVLEAQAAGVPVVASRVGGIPDLIEDNKTGILVDSGNSNLLANAIIELLKNPEHARSIGVAARKHVEENFSSRMMTAETLKLYKSVIKNRK